MVPQIPRSFKLLFRITIVEAPQPYGCFEVKRITQYSYVRFVNLVNSFRCLLFCREIFRLPTQILARALGGLGGATGAAATLRCAPACRRRIAMVLHYVYCNNVIPS